MMVANRAEAAQDLERRLSEPSEADTAFVRDLEGDILILGAGGKMGPSLAKLAKRAVDRAGVRKRVIAISRFSSDFVRRELEAAGIDAVAGDLLDPTEVRRLPESQNVLYLAGRKFGSTDRPDLTWATNAMAPAFIAHQYRASRIVAFSTGNVYGFTAVSSGGSRESDALVPVGEYAQSCLARERTFEYCSNEYGTPCLLFRLNYAVDLRYGVMVDIARKVYSGEPVDLTVPAFNVIWQRDANSYALRALELCTSPGRILNVTGTEIIAVREIAEWFGERFGRECRFQGAGGTSALLSNASLCHSLLGLPSVSAAELREWVAKWIETGGESLDKPTHFEVADGGY